MPNTKSKQGQSFLDMVIQQSGNFENVITAAVLNNVALSNAIKIGTQIKTDVDVTSLVEPATSLGNASELVPQQKGIGWMQIGKTFKIN